MRAKMFFEGVGGGMHRKVRSLNVVRGNAAPPDLRFWVAGSQICALAHDDDFVVAGPKQIEVRFSWSQDIVRQMRLEMSKVRGDLNPPDASTKPKPLSELRRVSGFVNIRVVPS